MLEKCSKYRIEDGEEEYYELNPLVPPFKALYQLNRKLYLLGYSTHFYCLDYSGSRSSLNPIKCERDYTSLSGANSQLIALGGYHKGISLNSCEKYLVISNKWASLPSLN